jgi:hypothetical protein
LTQKNSISALTQFQRSVEWAQQRPLSALTELQRSAEFAAQANKWQTTVTSFATESHAWVQSLNAIRASMSGLDSIRKTMEAFQRDSVAVDRIASLVQSLTALNESQLHSVLQVAASASVPVPSAPDAAIPSEAAFSDEIDRAVSNAASEGVPSPLGSPVFWKSLPWYVQLAIFLILSPVWQWVIARGLDSLVQMFNTAESEADRTTVLVSIEQTYGSLASDSLRTVNARSLRIREEPGRNATVVGQLKRGTLVIIVTHEGPWVLVRYSADGSADLREGWVASAHLRKLSLPAVDR